MEDCGAETHLTDIELFRSTGLKDLMNQLHYHRMVWRFALNQCLILFSNVPHSLLQYCGVCSSEFPLIVYARYTVHKPPGNCVSCRMQNRYLFTLWRLNSCVLLFAQKQQTFFAFIQSCILHAKSVNLNMRLCLPASTSVVTAEMIGEKLWLRCQYVCFLNCM